MNSFNGSHGVFSQPMVPIGFKYLPFHPGNRGIEKGVILVVITWSSDFEDSKLPMFNKNGTKSYKVGPVTSCQQGHNSIYRGYNPSYNLFKAIYRDCNSTDNWWRPTL